MPTPSKSFPDEPATSGARRPFYKRPLPMLGLIVSVVIVTVACLLLWAGYKYQALVELGKKTGGRYAEIETGHPFATPEAGETLSARRWEAMFAVRRRVAAKITPGMENAVVKLTSMEKPRGLAAAAELMGLTGDFEAMVDEHLAALEENAMSASEYCWLLGLAVNGALADEDASAAGQAYREILGEAERISRANEDSRDDLDAEKLVGAIDKAFDGRTPGPAWVVEDLAAGSRVVYVLDLLTLALGEHADKIQ